MPKMPNTTEAFETEIITDDKAKEEVLKELGLVLDSSLQPMGEREVIKNSAYWLIALFVERRTERRKEVRNGQNIK